MEKNLWAGFIYLFITLLKIWVKDYYLLTCVVCLLVYTQYVKIESKTAFLLETDRNSHETRKLIEINNFSFSMDSNCLFSHPWSMSWSPRKARGFRNSEMKVPSKRKLRDSQIKICAVLAPEKNMVSLG